MTLTPRASEVKQVASLLESEDYDTPQELAKDVLKLVASLLSERDSYGVSFGLRSDDLRLAKGPYWGKTQAEKEVRRLKEAGVVAYSAPLFSTLVEPDKVTGECKCGHPKERHHNSWGCATYNRDKTRCSCKGFTT